MSCKFKSVVVFFKIFDFSFDFKYIAREFTLSGQAPQRLLEVAEQVDANKIIVRDKGLLHHK